MRSAAVFAGCILLLLAAAVDSAAAHGTSETSAVIGGTSVPCPTAPSSSNATPGNTTIIPVPRNGTGSPPAELSQPTTMVAHFASASIARTALVWVLLADALCVPHAALIILSVRPDQQMGAFRFDCRASTICDPDARAAFAVHQSAIGGLFDIGVLSITPAAPTAATTSTTPPPAHLQAPMPPPPPPTAGPSSWIDESTVMTVFIAASVVTVLLAVAIAAVLLRMYRARSAATAAEAADSNEVVGDNSADATKCAVGCENGDPPQTPARRRDGGGTTIVRMADELNDRDFSGFEMEAAADPWERGEDIFGYRV